MRKGALGPGILSIDLHCVLGCSIRLGIGFLYDVFSCITSCLANRGSEFTLLLVFSSLLYHYERLCLNTHTHTYPYTLKDVSLPFFEPMAGEQNGRQDNERTNM